MKRPLDHIRLERDGNVFQAVNQDGRVLRDSTDAGPAFLARAFGWREYYSQADIRACGGLEARAYERAAVRWLDAHVGMHAPNDFIYRAEVGL